MKIKSPFLNRTLGITVAAIFQRWMNTLDYRIAFYDRSCDPTNVSCTESGIHVCWHEYVPVPLQTLGRANMSLLVSRHGDAELLAQVADFLGFGTVRGSTNRGGAAALRELVKSQRRFHIGVAPDGPQGPRRRLSPGIIFLSSRLGMPIVCTGAAYDRPWRVNSWDRFAIPRLFSRCRLIMGPRYLVPPNLDRQQIEQHRLCVERRLEVLTQEAEAWAASGVRRHDEHSLHDKKQERLEKTTAELASLAAPAVSPAECSKAA